MGRITGPPGQQREEGKHYTPSASPPRSRTGIGQGLAQKIIIFSDHASLIIIFPGTADQRGLGFRSGMAFGRLIFEPINRRPFAVVGDDASRFFARRPPVTWVWKSPDQVAERFSGPLNCFGRINPAVADPVADEVVNRTMQTVRIGFSHLLISLRGVRPSFQWPPPADPRRRRLLDDTQGALDGEQPSQDRLHGLPLVALVLMVDRLLFGQPRQVSPDLG
jgi:hypothetical protein